MTTQDIDKLMQTIISMKEHKVVKNRIDKVVFRYLRGFQKDSTVEFHLPITVIVGEYSTHSEPLCPPLKATCSIV